MAELRLYLVLTAEESDDDESALETNGLVLENVNVLDFTTPEAAVRTFEAAKKAIDNA